MYIPDQRSVKTANSTVIEQRVSDKLLLHDKKCQVHINVKYTF